MAESVQNSPTVKVCPFPIWCCGDLRTATICIGVTNIVSLILLTSYYVGTTLYHESFNLNILVIPMLVMFIVFVNVGLVYGATNRFKWTYVPWMVVYLPATLALLIFCSIKFSTLAGQQLSVLILVFVSGYFYAVVVSSYIELTQHSRLLKGEEEKSKGPIIKDYLKADASKKPAFLIDLTEMETLNETNRLGDSSAYSPNGKAPEGDETFTQIANRDSSNANGFGGVALSFEDSGEFTLPHVEEPQSPTQLNFSNCFATDSNLLPVPEEVIQIEQLVESTPQEQLNLSPDQAKTIDFSFKSLSTVDVSLRSQKSLAAKSDSRLLADVSKHVVNMDLVDSTFSPFKVKNGTDPTLLPKMKIFLPKNDDDSSKSSSEEDLALKNSH